MASKRFPGLKGFSWTEESSPRSSTSHRRPLKRDWKAQGATTTITREKEASWKNNSRLRPPCWSLSGFEWHASPTKRSAQSTHPFYFSLHRKACSAKKKNKGQWQRQGSPFERCTKTHPFHPRRSLTRLYYRQDFDARHWCYFWSIRRQADS